MCTQVKPCQAGLETGWLTSNKNPVMKAPVPMTLTISKQSACLQDRIHIPGNVNQALIKICIYLLI